MTWEPSTITRDEVIEPGPVRALTALFDDGVPPPDRGDELPPSWHWVALSQWPASSELGVDGHPARGSFLPPVELPRRMFAGGELTYHSAIRIGSTVRRDSSVLSVTDKSGRSGRLVVVVVGTRLYDERGALALEEMQDLIYRDAPAGAHRNVSSEPAAHLVLVGSPLTRLRDWTWDFATDPTLLMRFSSATCNTHRIHYDWPYATAVEGYPGLVVHGLLMTLALAEVSRREHRWGRVVTLRHRNLKPLFCGEAAQVRRLEDPTEGSVATRPTS